MVQLDKKISEVPSQDVFNLQSTILYNDKIKERLELHLIIITDRQEFVKKTEKIKQINLYKNLFALDKSHTQFTRFSENGHQFTSVFNLNLWKI